MPSSYYTMSWKSTIMFHFVSLFGHLQQSVKSAFQLNNIVKHDSFQNAKQSRYNFRILTWTPVSLWAMNSYKKSCVVGILNISLKIRFSPSHLFWNIK
jgi:hypothetical protein